MKFTYVQSCPLPPPLLHAPEGVKYEICLLLDVLIRKFAGAEKEGLSYAFFLVVSPRGKHRG